jgi:hypothetical protein
MHPHHAVVITRKKRLFSTKSAVIYVGLLASRRVLAPLAPTREDQMKTLKIAMVAATVMGSTAFAEPGRRPTVDRAPSGRENSRMDVYQNRKGQTYTITHPGRDAGTVERSGKTITFDFDRAPKQPGHPDDTTIVDHRKKK